ncbi:hypothetical protein ACEPAG_6764 [Sanghuangporus baumii]
MVWVPITVDDTRIRDTYQVEHSRLSDHALIKWELPQDSPPPPQARPPLDESKREDWMRVVIPAALRILSEPAKSKEDLDERVDRLTSVMRETALELRPTKPSGNKKVEWWNAECRQALDDLCDCSPNERDRKARRLRTTIRKAKRTYYEEKVDNANPSNIWQWAKAGRGIRPTPIPSLREGRGSKKKKNPCSALAPPVPVHSYYDSLLLQIPYPIAAYTSEYKGILLWRSGCHLSMLSLIPAHVLPCGALLRPRSIRRWLPDTQIVSPTAPTQYQGL